LQTCTVRLYIFFIGLFEIFTGLNSHKINGGAAGFTLKLPGKKLDLSALSYAKKYRDYDYKTGATKAFNDLEEAGFGSIEETKTTAGTKVDTVLSLLIVLEAKFLYLIKQVATSVH